ncbi:histidine kinase [Myxococcus sp. K15C18031901]|uniref:sensor histidine kinase n=1 Tax=Myxococcus dinghuensis TaxID=2906761 RepID=UPI0020A816C7|nr:histidine kinase [Myxococcus dinghuensis]MCP3100922.1 histidine kinase [Myxococcus dinghuensis]
MSVTVLASGFFIARLTCAWLGLLFIAMVVWSGLASPGSPPFPEPFLLALLAPGYATLRAISHARRVRLLVDRVDSVALANRQRRQVELPFEAVVAFELVDAALLEMAPAEMLERSRERLQVRARLPRLDPYPSGSPGRWRLPRLLSRQPYNQVLATVTPGEGVSRVTVICEPLAGAWLDLFRVDDGTNLENAEALTRALTRHVSEQRRREQEAAKQTATEKELAVARLNLLQAQVEPHFLYNTLANAQVLTRVDPARAGEMLGHLITYLRHSLPRTSGAPSTLGEELERSRAYLDIMKIRMGDRLSPQLDVPESLRGVPFPPMMLQTLVENALKHGLEPRPGGGTVWIRARANGDRLSVTVADDGQGLGAETAGTGVGLRNVRERLRLAHGDRASFVLTSNFPSGVAATLTLPLEEVDHAPVRARGG